MEEIEIRAWDGKRMIFLSNLMIGIGKGYLPDKEEAVRDKEPYAYFSKDTFNGEVRLGSHEVMLFTGFKDKNGKKIYHHDIIVCHQAPTNEVIWYYGSWCYRNYHAGALELGALGNPYTNEGLLQCEVIGNIYENPDLMQE